MIVAGNMFLKKDKRYSIANNIFTINSVKRTDSGYYSCVYQHDNDRINVTHSLDVYYKPNIKIKQDAIDVVMGSSATLNCEATGNPNPKITWKKSEGRMPSGAEEEIGNNITFEDVDRHVGGSYVCTASNGVGSPATAQREIIVSYEPEIRTENVNTYDLKIFFKQ